MKIDRRLNLVLTLEREDGSPLHVFSTPIGREVFETYFMVISKTFSRIYAENLSFLGGPRVCAMMIKDVALNTARPDRTGNMWEGPDGVENGLMNEIRRLTNVLIPAEGGWTVVPYADALARRVMDEEEASEVEGAITFFTVNWLMHKKATARAILEAAAGMWGWLITSSPLSDYKNGLQTSTPTEPSGPKAQPSSIPS
jgi:hypothetical protein